jgi:GT2 family glycosyltransferase
MTLAEYCLTIWGGQRRPVVPAEMRPDVPTMGAPAMDAPAMDMPAMDMPGPAATRVLVIVLNFNGLDDTLGCLDSLRRQSCRCFDIVLIDNGSRADDLDLVARRFPGTEVIALAENRGWAGGNNVGLRLAMARGYGFACLLNNDTVLAPGALAELLAAAAAVGGPCLLQPMIHFHADPERAQLDPGAAPLTRDAAARRLADAHGVVELGYAYGACLLLPAAVLAAVGLLDERFFLQLEEQDYYRRAAALGLRSYCARRARMLHKESASFGGRMTPTKIYYLARNSLLLAEKHDASPGGILRGVRKLLWSLQHEASRTGAAASWPGLLRWLLSADAHARAVRQGLGDYLRRRFGPRPPPRSATLPRSTAGP